jgi:(2Fe-2S) ferredoxin
MSELAKPRYRIVLCRGEFCNLGRRADTLYQRLNEAVNEANRDLPPGEPPLASLRTANCLSMCGNGPNCVIYPEDAVFNRLDSAALEALIDAYLKQNQETR